MSEIEFRRAQAPDLPAIVAMLADDALGAGREDPSTPLAPSYLDAFRAIDADPNQLLAVAVEAGQVVGTLQLSFLPGISRKGAWRARGCSSVQLTTDKSRREAHAFYERLGFTASHLGYKMAL
jgi:hypothetical protein